MRIGRQGLLKELGKGRSPVRLCSKCAMDDWQHSLAKYVIFGILQLHVPSGPPRLP